MKQLIIIVFMLFAVSIQAADQSRIYIDVTVTNVAETGDTLALAGAVRTFTNAHSSTTILTNLVSKNATATNVFNGYNSYILGSGITHAMRSTNVIRFTAPLGFAFTGAATGDWASITIRTQAGPETYNALWPMENMVGETNRTNQGTALVRGMGIYSTVAFPTNATALSNHLQRGAGPLQPVISPVNFWNISGTNTGLTNGSVVGATIINAANITGTASRLTNGYWTNAVFDSPKMTNGVNYGTAFSSVGDGSSSEQFGAGAHARNDNDTAVGAGATATNGNATVVGQGSTAKETATAVGASSTANTNTVSVGYGVSGDGAGNVLIGAGADDNDYDNVIVIGANAAASGANQVSISSASQTVSFGGPVVGTTTTNTVLKGTNVLNGRLDFAPRSNSGLANGYNSGVVLGTNVYIRFSGPSGAYTNVGFAAGQDGSYHVAQFDNPGLSFTLLHDSGLDAAAANRIHTGTGALINSTNNPVLVHLIYDGSVSRWRVLTIR